MSFLVDGVDAVKIAPSIFQILRRRSSDGVDGEFGASFHPVDELLRRRTTP
jgi:hypothetical protein